MGLSASSEKGCYNAMVVMAVVAMVSGDSRSGSGGGGGGGGGGEAEEVEVVGEEQLEDGWSMTIWTVRSCMCGMDGADCLVPDRRRSETD